MTDPLIKRSGIRSVVGVQVDELKLSLLCNPTVMYGNIPLTQFAREGGFDGARLDVTRDFYAAWNTESCGSLNLFNGRVGPLTVAGSEIQMTVKSDLELLDIQMPRNIYMASCQHTLYDAACRLVPATWTVTGNVTANSTSMRVNSNLAQADGYFELGVMKFISGQNNQAQRSIRLYANGALSPMLPWPYTPLTGDLFTARPGCDKLDTTCDVKFSNKANFRGYPYIPAPETSY